jgi:hypothetical protein
MALGCHTTKLPFREFPAAKNAPVHAGGTREVGPRPQVVCTGSSPGAARGVALRDGGLDIT